MKRAVQFWGGRNGERGFTLMEMVIALFVVSVVMAIALPNLQKAGVNAADTGCEGNQKLIRAALEEYYVANRAYPQDATTALILNDLKTNGYIESIPTCPSNGDYVIQYSPDGTQATVSCTVHGQLGA